uniref:ANF_receptor domain-containing protein n=1 Tax=Macrostomum lignano TaxID=282301 RepID=A0A1I8HRD9_9PLAT
LASHGAPQGQVANERHAAGSGAPASASRQLVESKRRGRCLQRQQQHLLHRLWPVRFGADDVACQLESPTAQQVAWTHQAGAREQVGRRLKQHRQLVHRASAVLTAPQTSSPTESVDCCEPPPLFCRFPALLKPNSTLHRALGPSSREKRELESALSCRRYPRYFFNTTADARPNVVRIGVHGRRRTAGLLLAVLLRDLFGYKRLMFYYYVGNQLNSGCPLEIYNPDSPFPYNIVACNQTHNFSEVLRHSTGTYIHLSRRPVTQRKLLLKQLADRDPNLTQFLRDFSLPFTFSMYSPSQVCEWLDYNLSNFVQLWPSPRLSLAVAPIRIGLIWPSGFEFDDPSVLEFAKKSVGILNSWRCQGNAKDAAFCSLLLSNHQFELVPAGLDCLTSSVLAFYMGLHCSDLSAESASPLAGVWRATCSKTAEPVAQASSRLGTAVVSPTVESPLFNRRDVYPNFYRTVPSYSAYPEVVASFLRKYSWEKLALLTNQKLFYSSLDFNEHLCLVEVVAEKDLTLHRALDSLRRAKEAQCQVIVMDYFRRGTCLYLCAAHQLAMSQRNNYAFILANWAKEIFTDAGANCTGTGALADEFAAAAAAAAAAREIGGCTNAEITAVSDGHLIVKNYLPPARLAVYRRRLNLTVAKLPSCRFSEGYMMVWLRRYRANGAGYHGRVLAANPLRQKEFPCNSQCTAGTRTGNKKSSTVEEIPVDPSESNEAVGFATTMGFSPPDGDLCPTRFLTCVPVWPGWSCLVLWRHSHSCSYWAVCSWVLFGLLRYCQRRMRRKQSQPFKDIRERLSHKEGRSRR